MPNFPAVRMRRLRKTPALRTIFQETILSVDRMVYPIFVDEGATDFGELGGMPGIRQIPEKFLPSEMERVAKLGIKAVMLFGISHNKDLIGSETWKPDGLIARMIRSAKSAAPEVIVISDTCFCEYTTHGHCGVIDETGQVINDVTLQNIARQSVNAAEAGADMIAPSSMMDGQILTIRQALDAAGFSDTSIMAYSTKFASGLYGPFREAAGCELKGDRKAYQMNPLNGREAIRESVIDENEGADILMVKPALAYLDVITSIRSRSLLPLAAYQVSGEYSMVKFAARAKAIHEGVVIRETLGSIARAGADIIISYFAPIVAKLGYDGLVNYAEFDDHTLLELGLLPK